MVKEFMSRKLQNKNYKTTKQSIKHIAQLKKWFCEKCFQKNEKNENLLDFIEKMTEMTKSKNDTLECLHQGLLYGKKYF